MDNSVCGYIFSSWSDGVPTEGISGVAVLARISTMSMIRAKVVEFEDYNLIPDRLNKVRSRKWSRQNAHQNVHLQIYRYFRL